MVLIFTRYNYKSEIKYEKNQFKSIFNFASDFFTFDL